MKKIILIVITLVPVFIFSQESSYKRILCENILKTIFEEKYNTPKFSIYSKDDVLVISCNYQINNYSLSELSKQSDKLAVMLYKSKQNDFQFFSDFSNKNVFNDILNEYKYILFRTNYITSDLETIPIYCLLSFDDFNIIKQNVTEKSFIEILQYIP